MGLGQTRETFALEELINGKVKSVDTVNYITGTRNRVITEAKEHSNFVKMIIEV